MSYLARFPIDILKIDRSFVAAMGRNPQSMSLVRTIIGLAHNPKLVTVAEGIEEMHQLAELRRLGCNMGQGFMMSAPVRASAIEEILTNRGEPAWPEEPPEASRAAA